MDIPGTSGVKRSITGIIGDSLSKRRKTVNAQDTNFEKTVAGWLDETDFSDCDDNCSEDFVPSCSDHDSSSEQGLSDADPTSSESEEDNGDLPRSRYYYGKNNYKWAKEPPNRAVRTPRHNIIMRFPATKLRATDPKDSFSLWHLLFDDDILNHILQWTNTKIRCVREKYSDRSKSELQNVDMEELLAFFGLLVYSAVFKSNHENADYLFATDGTGREIFRCVMSRNRFLMLLNCLRFDDFTTRQERLKDDKMAAISFVFQKFVENCKKYYNIGTCGTIDEQLVPFRGKCAYTVYMPKKPAKYGLKVMSLCDARTSYFFNGYMYTGKGSDGNTLPDEEKKLLIPTQCTLRLCQPIYGSNRNITADNWFGSIQLTEELRKRGLTFVGTLKKNKREIPDVFQPKRHRDVQSSLYGFTKDITLISHVPRKNRAVCLVSSMHHSPGEDKESKKPEIISFYNTTKGGVDELDKKCSIYSCSRRTRRWPMCVFYRLMDISTVNAYVLQQVVSENPPNDRGKFLRDLARQLVLKHMQRRVENPRLPRELRTTIRRVLGPDAPREEVIEAVVGPNNRETCRICPPNIKRKTSHSCFICKKPICMQCSSQVCKQCCEDM